MLKSLFVDLLRVSVDSLGWIIKIIFNSLIVDSLKIGERSLEWIIKSIFIFLILF